jgi:hypothetical protein
VGVAAGLGRLKWKLICVLPAKEKFLFDGSRTKPRTSPRDHLALHERVLLLSSPLNVLSIANEIKSIFLASFLHCFKSTPPNARITQPKTKMQTCSYTKMGKGKETANSHNLFRPIKSKISDLQILIAFIEQFFLRNI